MAEIVLEMKGIDKSFGATHALNDVSFTVEKGEVHMLLGENGAGKSTLMKILAGSLSADRGTILLDGKEVQIDSPAAGRRLGISMVYQELALIGPMTVLENVLLGDMNTKGKTNLIDSALCKERCKKVLERVGLGDININAVVDSFGLGIRQLIEIAKGLSGNAKLIILDEPTSALTQSEVETLFGIVRGLQEEGISFIFITHKLEEVDQIGSRVSVLRDGKVIGETQRVGEIDEHEMITRMVGREINDFYPKQYNLKPDAKTVLSVEKLYNAKYFHDVTFEVKEGEVLGVAGLAGSGNTEIMEAIFGLKQIESGKVIYHGEDVTGISANGALKKGFGMLSRDRKSSILLHLPIYCNIALSNFIEFVKAKIFRIQKKEQEAAKQYGERLRLKAASIAHTAGSLSGGNQQKVAIARLLCAHCDLFIFDDPTRGIDVGAKVDVYNSINELTAEGKSVILISSQLPELLGMADRIMVVADGTIGGILDAKTCTQVDIMKIIAGGKEND